MDAKNDTEVVKQSMSSAISVFIGIAIIGVTLFVVFKALYADISNIIIILLSLLIYVIIYLGLKLLLHKICDRSFDNIVV